MLAFWRARPPELAEKQVATMQPILYSRNSERNWSNIEVCLKKNKQQKQELCSACPKELCLLNTGGNSFSEDIT